MTNLITFPASTGLPHSVVAAWGIYQPGTDARLFVLDQEEASCIDVYDPISQFHIAFTQGCPRQCQDWVNRHFGLKDDSHFTLEATGKGHCFTLRKKRLIIVWLCVPPREDAGVVFAIAAHEALHATYAIMDGMGMKPDFANEEFVAYKIQWLLNNYLQCIGLPVPMNDSPQ